MANLEEENCQLEKLHTTLSVLRKEERPNLPNSDPLPRS
jgi:hypothetical protein